MLIFDFRAIGNRMYECRKSKGLTQAELAEKANISDRTYAEIERGTVNMRVETLLQICKALNVTPDELLVKDDSKVDMTRSKIMELLEQSSGKKQAVALRLLGIFLSSDC